MPHAYTHAATLNNLKKQKKNFMYFQLSMFVCFCIIFFLFFFVFVKIQLKLLVISLHYGLSRFQAIVNIYFDFTTCINALHVRRTGKYLETFSSICQQFAHSYIWYKRLIIATRAEMLLINFLRHNINMVYRLA